MTESFPNAARDQTLLRRVNELSVLAALRGGGPRPLREVADATGLSWRSTQVVVETLDANGWLAEAEAETAGEKRLGRPARRYRFRAEAGHVVGLDVGRNWIQVLVADLDAAIVASRRTEVSPGDSSLSRLAAAERVVQEALADAGITPDDVWAATLGATGVVAPDGTVTASDLPGWTGLKPAALLAAVLPCPVAVENDCNLAVLAERWRGHRAETMIYVLAGTRLGSGLVIGGQLHRGTAGAAGEIGELRELGWYDAAERLIAAAAGDADAGVDVAADADVDAAAKQVFDAARDGDASALAAVDQFASDVARGITLMTLTIDPELVVLGGGFTHASDLLLPRLEAKLAGTCRLHTPRLAASDLGDDAVALGAVRRALDAVDERMTSLDSSTALVPAAIRQPADRSA
ncbi:putative NBD/HSP70 family sugar kinase [Catenulispora sp. MAP5-51]|uniref:ROK family protein n=1 Tax=Catenulispora sp. MAP5-51 TaxID=3156298 RepID=UPI003514D059